MKGINKRKLQIRASKTDIDFIGKDPRVVLKYLKICELCRQGFSTFGCLSRFSREAPTSIRNRNEYARINEFNSASQWISPSDESIGFCCACCSCDVCQCKIDSVANSETTISKFNIGNTDIGIPTLFDEEAHNNDKQDTFNFSTEAMDNRVVPQLQSSCPNEMNYLLKISGDVAGVEILTHRINIERMYQNFTSAAMPVVQAEPFRSNNNSYDHAEDRYLITTEWPAANNHQERSQMFFPRGCYFSVMMYFDVHDTIGQ